MISTIEQERIVKLINNKIVDVLDMNYCKSFDTFICDQYTWNDDYKDIINWGAVPNIQQIKDIQLFSNEAKNFIKSTCLSSYDYLAIIYEADKPGVIGKSDDIINNLSDLSFHTPWIEFIVGAIKNKYGIFELVNNDFVEVWKAKCIMTAPGFGRP